MYSIILQCFVKFLRFAILVIQYFVLQIPVHPEYSNSKKNFWKVDETRITHKMLRRHFSGMLDIFPDLATRLRKDSDTTEGMYAIHNPRGASAFQKEPVTKFSGPFSIESILKKDTCSRTWHKSSVLYILPSTLDGRNQDLKSTRMGIGMKRKSGIEDGTCGAAENRSELRQCVGGNAKAAHSNRYYSTYSTQEIQSITECHQAFRPTKRMRMCPDLPDTILPRKDAGSQFHRALNFNVHNHLLHPLNVYPFTQRHFGL